jgi:hypothetical protein
VSLLTVGLAHLPLNLTDVAPVNPEPVTVTTVPTGPLPGLKPETVGMAPAEAGSAMIATTNATITAVAPVRVHARLATDVRFILTLPWIAPMSWSSLLQDVRRGPGLLFVER